MQEMQDLQEMQELQEMQAAKPPAKQSLSQPMCEIGLNTLDFRKVHLTPLSPTTLVLGASARAQKYIPC